MDVQCIYLCFDPITHQYKFLQPTQVTNSAWGMDLEFEYLKLMGLIQVYNNHVSGSLFMKWGQEIHQNKLKNEQAIIY